MVEYTCANCGEKFTAAWTDADAKRELEENFGDVDTDACDVVCDDCYKKFMEWYD